MPISSFVVSRPHFQSVSEFRQVVGIGGVGAWHSGLVELICKLFEIISLSFKSGCPFPDLGNINNPFDFEMIYTAENTISCAEGYAFMTEEFEGSGKHTCIVLLIGMPLKSRERHKNIIRDKHNVGTCRPTHLI